MATLKQRLHRKNSSNVYDTIHLESESGVILRPNGRHVEADLGNLPVTRTVAGDPTGLIPVNQIAIGPSNVIYLGLNDGIAVFEGNPPYRWNRYNAVSTTYYIWSRYTILESVEQTGPTSRKLSQTMSSTAAYRGFITNGTSSRDTHGIVGMAYDGFTSPDTINFDNYITVLSNNRIQVKRYDQYGGTACMQSVTLFNSIPSASSLSWATRDGDYYLLIETSNGVPLDFDLPLDERFNAANYDGRYACIAEYVSSGTSNPYEASNQIVLHFYSFTLNRSQGSLVQSGIQSTNASQYPSNGISGDYWYRRTGVNTVYSQGSFIDVVYGTTENQYPTNGRHTDGYWYVKI